MDFIFQLTKYQCNNTYDMFFLDLPRIFLEQDNDIPRIFLDQENDKPHIFLEHECTFCG